MDYTIDKKNHTIAIKVPLDSEKFKIFKYDKYFYFNYHLGKTEIGWAFFFNDFGGKKQYPVEVNFAGVEIESDHKVIHYSYERT